MSKAIAGAAMLGGAVALGATAFFLASSGVGFAAMPWLIGGMEALASGGIAMEAAAVASALTSNRGMNITTRQAAAARQVIYGEQRVGGVTIYRSTTGNSKDQQNYIIVLAGHTIENIVNLYLDGRQVYWNGTGGVLRNGIYFGGNPDSANHTGPDGVQYNFGGKVFCSSFYGDQTFASDLGNPGGGFSAAMNANDPTWGPDGKGGLPCVMGCAYVYLKLEYDSVTFPSDPEIRFTIRGKNDIYDPRTNTTGYSTNWALIAANVITDPVFGLGDDSVNQEQLIAAANVCDEQVALAIGGTESRYTTHYHTDTTQGPGDILAAMMTGAAGRLSRIGGEWFLWPAYWQGPSFNFDQSAITGNMQWTPYRSASELVNRVNGTYIAPNYPYNTAGDLYDSNGFYNGMTANNFPFAFQPTNFPQYACDVSHGYASDQYLTEDGGTQRPLELSFATVLSVTQAQRVAKINLLRNRYQGSGTFPMSLAAWGMQACDVMNFTFPTNAWSGKMLEIVGTDFIVGDAGDGQTTVRCTMKVQETDPSIYAWSSTEELTVYDVQTIPTQTSGTPAPPTGMSLTSSAGTAIIAVDGSVQPRIEVQWTTPLDTLVTQIQMQYQAVGAASWIDGGLVDVSLNSGYLAGVVSGQAYNVRIRSLRANGAASVWEEIDGYTVTITLSVTSQLAVAQSALTGVAITGGTGNIIVDAFSVTIGSLTASCTPVSPITGLVQGQAYWVYYVDPTFAGGSVTPIATQTQSDYLGKSGYYLIGSVTIPTGTTTYQPTAYVDFGACSTTTPAAAYGNNSTQSAEVYGYCDGTTVYLGQCRWLSFPDVTPSGDTLHVQYTVAVYGSGSLCTLYASFDGGATSTLMLSQASNGSGTSSIAVPSGTDLDQIQVIATASPESGVTSWAEIEIFNIYVG